MVSKKKRNQILMVLGVLVVFGLWSGSLDISSIVGGAVTTPAPTPAPIPAPVGGIIQVVETVTFSCLPYDKFAPGATVDAECVIQKKNGNIWITIFDTDAAATATVTLSPGASYRLAVWNDDQTTNLSGTSITLADNNYMGYMEEFEMPFSSTVQWPADFPNTPYVGSYQDGALSKEFITNSDGTLNSASPEAIGTGANTLITLTLAAPNDACWGDPYANIPSTIDFNYATAAFKLISIPSGVKAPGVTGQRIGVAEVTYTLPFTAICDNERVDIEIFLEVKSGVDPAAHQNPSYWLNDACFYFDEEGTGFQYATYDSQDDVAICAKSAETSIDIS